jgi:hypothetical protein
MHKSVFLNVLSKGGWASGEDIGRPKNGDGKVSFFE